MRDIAVIGFPGPKSSSMTRAVVYEVRPSSSQGSSASFVATIP